MNKNLLDILLAIIIGAVALWVIQTFLYGFLATILTILVILAIVFYILRRLF